MASHEPDVDLDTDDAFYTLHPFIFKYDAMRKGMSLSIPRHDISDLLGFSQDIPEVPSTPDSSARADRVSRLLDAFVKICLHHTGDVFALSIGLRPSTNTTGTPENPIFTIVGNDTPPIGLKDYLGSIWARLQQISLLEKEARAKGDHPDAPDSNTSGTPPAVTEANSRLIKGLHHDIHSFCFRQTKSCLTDFEKEWNKFYPFYLETSRNTITDESSKVQNLLSTVCRALDIILNRLEECTPEFVEAHSDLWHAYWKLVKIGPGYEDDD
ncbi:hypothetical protein BDD12DRAFT_227671 [Trichophaea hybrida]|nr:hypothetical protein BDD12DRAFT_227671 [Trichophaea hybrida]